MLSNDQFTCTQQHFMLYSAFALALGTNLWQYYSVKKCLSRIILTKIIDMSYLELYQSDLDKQHVVLKLKGCSFHIRCFEHAILNDCITFRSNNHFAAWLLVA
jgi:hypothetical protein